MKTLSTVLLLTCVAFAQGIGGKAGVGGKAGFGSRVFGPGTPTMIQWTMGSNTKSGNAFGTTANQCANQTQCFFLPNGTQVNNAILSCATYSNTPASTPSWSDDQSNSWSVIATANDTTNAVKTACAVALNVAANTRQIKIAFGAAVTKEAPFAAEFNNILPSGATDGSSTNTSASGSSTMTAGSITPTAATDLFLMCGQRSQTPATTSFTVGSQSNITWKFLGTDLLDGMVCQWGLYTSTSALNPQLTMGTNSGYAAVAIALKTGAVGNARPNGIQIVGIQHEDVTDTIGNTSPIPIQFPCEGNLLVGSMGFGMASGTTWKATGVTDGNSNTWAATGVLLGNATTGQSQMYYAQNATCTNNMTVSVATTGLSDTTKDATILLYDIQNALTSNVFRQEAAVSNHSTGTGPSITHFDALAPGYTSGVAIFNLQEAQNTSTSISAPSGSGFDGFYYGGEGLSGGHPPDENNGWAHFTFATGAQQTWTTGFADSSSIGGYSYRSSFFGASGATKTALASETCTRTNVNPLSLTVWNAGPSYTGFKVVSNQCVPNALGLDDGVMYTAVGTLTDQIAQATIATITGGAAGTDKGIGLMLRGSIAAHTEYRFLASNATGVNTWIEKFVAGANTVILSCTASPAWAAADVMYVSAVGTTLTIKRGGSGGTTICTTTDSAIASGYPGMDYSSTMTGSALTNWQGGAPGDF